MDFNGFQEEIADQILEYLPDVYCRATVRLFYMDSLNGSYNALQIVGGGDGHCPAVNLDRCYEQFVQGTSIEDILTNIADIVAGVRRAVDIEAMRCYEDASKKLFFRVSSVVRNLEFLKKVPHRIVEDLVFTYHVAVELEKGEFGSGVVTNEVMEMYGVTEDELYYDAMQSCANVLGVAVKPLNQILFEGPAPFDDCGASESIRVVTSRVMRYGASILFCPGMMHRIAKEMQSGFFIIPSSVHELMLIPSDDPSEYERFDAIVHSVNSSCLSDKNTLSDHVYYYDDEYGIFARADHFVQLMEETEEMMHK